MATAVRHDKTADVLEEAVRRLVALADPERIVLFGSQARGDFRSSSDIDLLVVVSDGSAVASLEEAAYRALADLPVPVDVVMVSQAHVNAYGDLVGTVLRPALRDGVVLHARRD